MWILELLPVTAGDMEIRFHTLGEKLGAGMLPSFAKDSPEQDAEGLRYILLE